MPTYTALVAGAGGLTGSHLLQLLLQHPNYSQVTILVRHLLPVKHPKLLQITVNFDQLEQYAPQLAANHVFCCLGTTIKKAGSQDNFKKVDYHYIVNLAQLTAAAGAQQFLLVSSMGANPASSLFYSRVKGQTEQAIMQQPFSAIHIFRPSLLLGNRQEYRFGEQLAVTAFKALGFLMAGSLAKYRGIEAHDVAKAMLATALTSQTGTHIYLSDQIQQIANNR